MSNSLFDFMFRNIEYVHTNRLKNNNNTTGTSGCCWVLIQMESEIASFTDKSSG